MKTRRLLFTLWIAATPILWGQDVLRVDHYVGVKSTVPAMAGQMSQIYVREVVLAEGALRSAPAQDRVALFVHGAGTPAEVSFDVPYRDYSWMAFLARAGYDVFSMDMTGYGRSTRPPAMNDPCNLSEAQQKLYIPQLLKSTCTASYPNQMTTIASDWNDIDAVVNHIRALRGVDKVALLAWSLGGPRAGGYAGQHPEKVSKLVLLAPAYQRNAAANPPAQVPAKGTTFNTQSGAEFMANWDRQVGCEGQYDPAAAASVWAEMVASDPVGATSGMQDKQVNPSLVQDLYEDLGATQKVLMQMPCSSHNAMWERDHLDLFQASLEWLQNGTVRGASTGVQRFEH